MINYLETHPGHKIFKWNLKSLEIVVVENITQEPGNVISYEKEPECWYCSALNEANAKKQFEDRAKRLYETLMKNAQHD